MEVCEGKDKVLATKEREITVKEKALSDERQRVMLLTDECATLKFKLKFKLDQLTVSHSNGTCQHD